MKYWYLILFSFFFSSASFGQDNRKKVYYLADTISVSPSNQILNIQREGIFDGYQFYCRCILANQYVHPAFIYNINQSITEKFSKLPNYTYLSWKELEDMIYEKQQSFDKFYALEIVEKLPNGTYKKNKVKLAIIKTVTRQ